VERIVLHLGLVVLLVACTGEVDETPVPQETRIALTTSKGSPGSLTVEQGVDRVCWRMGLSGPLDGVKAAHLHQEDPHPKTEPVIATLFTPPEAPKVQGCVDVDSGVVEHLLDEQRLYYVDYHFSPRGRPLTARLELSRQREAGGFGADGPLYESLDELVSKSDLVVIGTVGQTLVGKVFGDDPTGKYPTRHLHTVIGVGEVLKGPDVGEVTVITDEVAFTGTNTEEWRTQGSRVVLFLTPSKDNEGLHILANINYIQTAYTLHGEDLRKTMGGDLYGLNDRIAGMSLPELRRAVSSS
jgi:hypothetical protein